MIGIALPYVTAPVTESACSIPTEADEDWITAVTPVPRATPFTGVDESLHRRLSILEPAARFKPSPMASIPKRNKARPVIRPNTADIKSTPFRNV
jgi:hypothetical protein